MHERHYQSPAPGTGEQGPRPPDPVGSGRTTTEGCAFCFRPLTCSPNAELVHEETGIRPCDADRPAGTTATPWGDVHGARPGHEDSGHRSVAVSEYTRWMSGG